MKIKLALIAAHLACGSALAEEGGSGHYLPGSMSSFVDSVPAKETFIARYNLLNYNGSVRRTSRCPSPGPVLSYAFKLGKVDMIAEAKWLPELDTTKRLEGDIVWFKLVAKF